MRVKNRRNAEAPSVARGPPSEGRADRSPTDNLTTDVHLAAHAIEAGGEVHSNDTDFARFQGLRWVNPLSPRAKKAIARR